MKCDEEHELSVFSRMDVGLDGCRGAAASRGSTKWGTRRYLRRRIVFEDRRE